MDQEQQLHIIFNKFKALNLTSHNCNDRFNLLITIITAPNTNATQNISLLMALVKKNSPLSLQEKYSILGCFEQSIIWDKLNSQEAMLLFPELILVSTIETMNDWRFLVLSGLIAGFQSHSDGLIKEQIFNCFASPQKQYIRFGFDLLSAVYDAQKFSEDHVVIATIADVVLSQEDFAFKKQMIKFMNSQLMTLEPAVIKKYSFLGLKVLQIAYQQIQYDNTDSILLTVIEILGQKSIFFLPYLSELNIFAKNTYLLPNYTNRRELIKALELVASKFPSFYKKNPSSLLIFLELIFLEMIKISYQIQQSFLNPPVGVQYEHQKDPNFEPILYGMKIIDKIFQRFDCHKLIEIFKSAIDQMSKNNDWRHKYVAIMAMSQISEYVKKKVYFSTIFEIIFANIDDQNPKIRYACLHALGQTVDDKRHIVHSQYFQITLQKIIQRMDDPVPSVKSHAFACFTNFAQDVRLQKVEPFVNQILQKVLLQLNCVVPLFQQNALSALFQIFNIMNKKVKNIDYMNIIKHLKIMADTKFIQLKNQILETYSKLLIQIGFQEQLLPYFIGIKSLLFKTMEEKDFSSCVYVTKIWQRLLKLNSYNFLDAEEQFKLIAYITAFLIDTLDSQQIQSGFHCLIALIYNGGKKQQKFYTSIQQLIQTVLNSEDRLLVKHVECYPLYKHLVAKARKTETLQIYKEYFKKYSLKLFEATNLIQPQTFAYLPRVILSLKKILQQYPQILDNNTVIALVNKIKELIESTLEAIQNLAAECKSEDVDQQFIFTLKCQIEIQEESMEQILELVEFIYDNYMDIATQKLVEYMAIQVSNRCLQSSSNNLIKIGIFIIDDIIDHINYQKIQNIWLPSLQMLLKYILSPSHQIRQSAAYGLGCWIKATPIHLVNQYYSSLIQSSLTNVYNVSPDEQNQKQYFWAQDNVAVAISKLMLSKFPGINKKNLLNLWLGYLPLKKDKSQSIKQHKLLLRLAYDQELVLTKNQQGLQNIIKILKICSNIYNSKKFSNQSINNEIKQYFKHLYQEPFIIENSDHIWINLKQEQRMRLTEIQMENFKIN